MSDQARQGCIRALRSLPRAWPPGTEFVVIEVHHGEESDTWDLVAYPMDRAGTQIDGLAITPLRSLFVHGATDAREVTETVAVWWQLAGGDRLTLPAYVAPHDHWQSFDVRAQRWIEDRDLYA